MPPKVILMKKFFLFAMIVFIANESVIAQKQKNKRSEAPFYSGVYRNVFREAGYSQNDIDAKVDKAYHDIFEGPHKVYFEVGDSMAYVSDLKNHDARTEGLSYGM